MRFFNLDALEPYKYFIKSSLEQDFTLEEILGHLRYEYGYYMKTASGACHFSYVLCKWGLFRKHWDYVQLNGCQMVINQIAQKMANDMSFDEAGRWWGPNASRQFECNENPLAIVLLSKANAEYRAEKQTACAGASLRDPASNSISEPHRKLERKACMTCGERVDGVIYCSKQCRPSASLEWYSHRFNRAATLTITEGFRTARSRFTSPSADSCATYDTTQFVPPPYALVDVNPPTPQFVPTKQEPPEEREIAELTLYSGPEKEPAWPSVVGPSLPTITSLDSTLPAFGSAPAFCQCVICRARIY